MTDCYNPHCTCTCTWTCTCTMSCMCTLAVVQIFAQMYMYCKCGVDPMELNIQLRSHVQIVVMYVSFTLLWESVYVPI